MARQQPGKNTTTEATASVAPAQEETTVSENVTPEEVAPQPDAAADSSAAETPIDLSQFEAALTAGLGTKNPENGEPADDAKQVVEAYKSLDGVKAKNAARALVGTKQDEAVDALEIQDARYYMAVGNLLTAAKGGSKKAAEPKAPVDNTDVYAQRLAALDIARVLAAKPENVKDDEVDEKRNTFYTEGHPQAVAYLEWLASDKDTRGDEPEVPKYVKDAAKISQGSVARASAGGGGTRRVHEGPRKSPAKHIVAVFADQPSGTFLSVGDIVSTKSDEYESGEASPGAISNALKAGDKTPGIEYTKPEGAKSFGGLKA